MYNPESNIAYSVLFHNVLILQKRTKLCGSFRRAAPKQKNIRKLQKKKIKWYIFTYGFFLLGSSILNVRNMLGKI